MSIWTLRPSTWLFCSANGPSLRFDFPDSVHGLVECTRDFRGRSRRGGLQHGDTIGYHTFLEIMGTAPLWVLQKLRIPEMSLVTPLSLTGIIFYGLVGFGASLAVGFFKIRDTKHSFVTLR